MALSNILRVFKAFVNPARGSSAGTMSEMPPSYAPRYPFNDAKETPGGHLVELDDTPGAERVQLTHRTGTHIEMRPDGSVKYKSMKNRQDVTIGDHEIIIQGDFNITVDGGSKIYIRKGELQIQADYGTAVNVKGELKISADNIRMQAKKKISLVAPFVDIGGGNGVPPYLNLPHGVVPVFGVPVPIMTGLGVPKIASIPVPSGTGLGAIPSIITSASTVVGHLNTIASYAKNLAKSKALFSTMKDIAGDPLVPEVDQPEELPLSNPVLYSGVTADKIRLRDRQFDSPDDVEDSEAYTAHLNVCEDLKDFLPAQKDLPGQKTLSDETVPAAEPVPVKAFALSSGTVSVANSNNVVVGNNTKFSEELYVGQTLQIKGTKVEIAAIQNNTSLILTNNWNNPSVANSVAYVHIIRPFSQFMDKYTYPPSSVLGSSVLLLSDMLRNYIPPTIEKDTSGLIVPPAPTQPTGTVTTEPTRSTYNSSLPESI